MAKKKQKNLYLDVAKINEWNEWCDSTGRVLSLVMPIAMDEYIKNNK